MREIKFRAWNRENKEFVDDDFSISKNGKIFFYENGDSYDIPNEIEIQQYTGLKDKNGKEIYEGDILKCTRSYWDIPRNLVVEWFGERYGLKNAQDEVDSEVMDKQSCFDVPEHEREIIGNIYENPELLD